MKRIVYTLITIIMLTVLFAVGVQALETDTSYTEEMFETIFDISGFNYLFDSSGNSLTTYYDSAYVEGWQYLWYGRRANMTTTGTYKAVIPISSNYDRLTVDVIVGLINYTNSNYITDEDVYITSIKGETLSGDIIDVSFNNKDTGIYEITANQAIVYLYLDIYYKYSSQYPWMLFGISSATGTTITPDAPTTEDLLTTIIELIQLDIAPAVNNIYNLLNLKHQTEITSISNLNNSNNNYNNIINSYKSGFIDADAALDDLISNFDNSLEAAVNNKSVEEAILANAQFQSKMKILEKYIEKSVANKYETVVTPEDKAIVDNALKLENEVLSRFDYEAFEAQIQYDSYYQKISNSSMLSLKNIYEIFLNSNIGQNFVIVPLTFSIISVLIGGFVVSVKVSQKGGGSDG